MYINNNNAQHARWYIDACAIVVGGYGRSREGPEE